MSQIDEQVRWAWEAVARDAKKAGLYAETTADCDAARGLQGHAARWAKEAAHA